MVVGLLTLELFLPDAQTLKAKRSLVRPLLESLRREWNLTVAEVGHRDAWQRATLAVATVNTEATGAHRTLTEAVRRIEHAHALQVLDYSIEML